MNITTIIALQSSSEFIREAIEEKLYKCGIEKKIVIADPGITKEK